MSRASLVALAAVLALAFASPASAQYRTFNYRPRLELAFDHGVAIGVTAVRNFATGDPAGGWANAGLALAADLRVYAPEGQGLVLRVGHEGAFISGLYTIDAGVAYRGALVGATNAGLELVATVGGSASYGTLVGIGTYSLWFSNITTSPATAVGGVWGSLHLDFWHRTFFVGLGLTTRVQWVDRGDGPIVTFVPAIRIGGDWRL